MGLSSKKLKEKRKKKNKFKKFAERVPSRWSLEKEHQKEIQEILDYKNIELLQKLITSQGKLFSRKRSGASARHQQMIKRAAKRARFLALLPYVG
jgi:small subunit ribosomal protein S18